jgi:hypothetical protein
MKKLLLLALSTCLLAFVILGCASVASGNDPLIVRGEQAEKGGIVIFDAVVNQDDSNRAFWKTNAPAFHAFAEWLRSPITIEQTNTLPRGVAIIKQLDDLKLAYKASASYSNAYYSALVTAESAITQGSAWITISTNSVNLK